MSAAGQAPNCDFSKGAVDIDGCPEIRRELQRRESDPNDPCQSSGALGMGACAQRRLEAAERRMNKAFQTLTSSIREDKEDDVPRVTLRKAQESWLLYRDTFCDFVGEHFGGVRMWKSTRAVQCKARMSAERAHELDRLRKDLNP